jgi:transaldolase
VSWGAIDGVTTNPTLVSKEGKDFESLIKEICTVIDGPISAEVISLDVKGMVDEAHKISKWHRNIVIKIPLTKEGLKATKILHKDGIKTNVTLCFSPTQALFAAKAGATYVSPFIGRLDDISITGMELIKQIKTIYDNYGFETQIIVASVRHPVHVVESAMVGADVATIPFDTLEKLVKHPLTDIGIERFLKDWEKIK